MPAVPTTMPAITQPAPVLLSVAASVPLTSGGISVPSTLDSPTAMEYVSEKPM